MSFFKGMDKAKAPIGANYFRAGGYLTYVRALKGMTSREGGKSLVHWEMVVVEVLNDGPAAADPNGPHSVGESVTWTINMGQDAGPGNLKAALLVVFKDLGFTAEQIDDPFCEQLIGPSNPMQGFFVEWFNKMGKTKKLGNPFTFVKAVRRWKASEVNERVPAAVLTNLKIDTSRADG